MAHDILIVDDESLNIDVAQAYLELAGYVNIQTTEYSLEAMGLIESFRPDLVLLDIHMPHLSGLEILKTVRADARLATTPVIILTATATSETKLEALECGATDLLPKPVHQAELLARIAAIMRRVDRPGSGSGNAGPLEAGGLVLEPGRHEARVGDTPLQLTPTEFRLLEALVRANGDIVPHLQLARAGWPAETDPDLLWLKPHLARLRAKVEDAGGPHVIAVRGVGYRIIVDDAIARVSATVSARLMPRKNTAMANAAAWPSEIRPELTPSTRKPISSASSTPPSRFLRMISCGSIAPPALVASF